MEAYQLPPDNSDTLTLVNKYTGVTDLTVSAMDIDTWISGNRNHSSGVIDSFFGYIFKNIAEFKLSYTYLDKIGQLLKALYSVINKVQQEQGRFYTCLDISVLDDDGFLEVVENYDEHEDEDEEQEENISIGTGLISPAI